MALHDKMFFVRLEGVKLLANIKSAQKRILVTNKKTEVNKAHKTEIKTYIKKFDAAIENGNIEEARELIKIIDKKLKRAAHKNLLHSNNASRKVSKLTRKLNNAI